MGRGQTPTELVPLGSPTAYYYSSPLNEGEDHEGAFGRIAGCRFTASLGSQVAIVEISVNSRTRNTLILKIPHTALAVFESWNDCEGLLCHRIAHDSI
jgi:hypothetical protein